MLDQEELKRILHYNPETGIFTWKITKGGNKPNSIAGAKDKLGYISISIKSKLYKAHRLAFLYMNGELPPSSVDHINGNPSDNSWQNLRLCSQKQNTWNQIGHGKYYKNVYLVKGGRKKPFNIKIEVDGIVKSFGYYETAEEADEVATLLRDLLHGEYSVKRKHNDTKEKH